VNARGPALALTFALAAALAGCGKAKEPEADPATEQAAARERARHDAFGTQVQAIDKANALGADINKKATENVDKVESQAK
jgi:hypothetical protein